MTRQNLIQRFFSKSEKNYSKSVLIKQFFASKNHLWIRQDKFLYQAISSLFELLPREKMQKIVQNRILFLRSSGRMSCFLDKRDDDFIVILFPDLIKLLSNAIPRYGMAILAHELGHFFYEHGNSEKNFMECQFEADAFAASLGLGEELIDILKSESLTTETESRIRYLEELTKQKSKRSRKKSTKKQTQLSA